MIQPLKFCIQKIVLQQYINKTCRDLAIEMYKTKINQNPDFLNDSFNFCQSFYDLRNEAYSSKKPGTVIYGTNSFLQM